MDVVTTTEPIPRWSIGRLNITIKRDFRICERCFFKQIRLHNTGNDKFDWEVSELTKEELRQKNLNILVN